MNALYDILYSNRNKSVVQTLSVGQFVFYLCEHGRLSLDMNRYMLCQFGQTHHRPWESL